MKAESYSAMFEEVAKAAGGGDELMAKLREVQEKYSGEAMAESYDKEDVMDDDGVKWKDRYSEAVDKYNKRFFEIEQPAVIRSQDEDIEKDGESAEISFEDLFEERQTKTEGAF